MVFNQDTKQFEYRDCDGLIEVWDEFEIGGVDMMVRLCGGMANDNHHSGLGFLDDFMEPR
jgi:hypothetical protein